MRQSSAEPLLSDNEFLTRFEACTIRSEDFHHRDHVRLAWICLQRSPLLEALRRFIEALRRFAAYHGALEKYHETITWAYILIIHDRMARESQAKTWEQFKLENTDLFDRKSNVLRLYYRESTLKSTQARARFLFPDRAGSLGDRVQGSREANSHPV